MVGYQVKEVFRIIGLSETSSLYDHEYLRSRIISRIRRGIYAADRLHYNTRKWASCAGSHIGESRQINE
jgi:hypothetical protein